MIKDNFIPKGELAIKLIDRKTGEVIEEKKLENDIASGLSFTIARVLAGYTDAALGKADGVSLWDASGNLIKFLDESMMTAREMITGTSDYKLHVTFRDASTDAYTVYEARLRFTATPPSGGTYTSTVARKTGINVNKTADKVLVVDWTVVFPFSA